MQLHHIICQFSCHNCIFYTFCQIIYLPQILTCLILEWKRNTFFNFKITRLKCEIS